MAYDINSCRFSGKLQGLKEIQTRTGTEMASFFLQCWKERIRIICFKELAEKALNTLHDGDRAEIAGRLQTSSWEHEGVKRYGFQIIADEIKPDPDQHGQDREREKSILSNGHNKPEPHGQNEYAVPPDTPF